MRQFSFHAHKVLGMFSSQVSQISVYTRYYRCLPFATCQDLTFYVWHCMHLFYNVAYQYIQISTDFGMPLPYLSHTEIYTHCSRENK